MRARRGTLALGSAEVALFSVDALRGHQRGALRRPDALHRRLAGETATDASFPIGYLERSLPAGARCSSTATTGCCAGRRCSCWRFGGVWLLYRSRRDQLSLAVPGPARDAERGALMCAAALGAQLLVAAFLAPTMFGFWFPPRHLLAALPLAIPLVAWALRHVPAQRASRWRR